MKTHKQKTNRFKKIIRGYYKDNNRNDLPWRKTKDPYHILVSEIMLQQTQVSRAIEKYESFLERFPNIESLANAALFEVLQEWMGLGYNRRAKYLHKTAQRVVEKHGGTLPDDFDQLQTLPGIGPATAGAICAFAFNKPTTFIETNIRRAYIDFFYPKKQKVADKDIKELVEITMDKKNPREWYWALMDYGSMLGKTKKQNPNRRSKKYSKQSPFKGSRRELRAKILRLILEEGPSKTKDVKEKFSKSKHDIKAILGNMTKEGILEKVGNSYRIP